MTKKNSNKRVSKADWLEKALDILEKDGVDAVKIDRLAKELKVSRSGFYWHFKDRRLLIQTMAKYWEEEFTVVVTANKKLLEGKPKERLYNIMRAVLEDGLTRLELPMRAAAQKDSDVWDTVNRAYQMRLDFLRPIFTELGFVGEDLEMRAHLFLCYQTWEESMFRTLSKERRSKWLKLRVELLCCSPNETN
jgi:AcrR family transcriptional regulator